MANIRLGPLVSEIRGSIGGTTFLRTIAGPAARARVKPVTTVSNTQALVKASLASIVQRWSLTLTETLRQYWRDLAAITTLKNSLGENFTPTGLQLYVRLNAFLAYIGETFIDMSPSQAVVDVPAFTIAYTPSAGFEVTAIGESSIQTGKTAILRSNPWPIGRWSQKGPWVARVIKDVTEFASLPVVIFPPTGIAPNKSYFIRARIWDSTTNGLSPEILIRCATPATL